MYKYQRSLDVRHTSDSRQIGTHFKESYNLVNISILLTLLYDLPSRVVKDLRNYTTVTTYWNSTINLCFDLSDWIGKNTTYSYGQLKQQ